MLDLRGDEEGGATSIAGMPANLLARVALLLAVAGGGTLGGPSAQARAASADVASTHTYIQASYALARASVARIPLVEHKARQLIRTLAQQCPKAGAGGPQNEASQPMSYEVAVALWALEYRAAAGPIRAFVHAIEPLHWTSPTTARIARRYAHDLSTLAALSVPPLCEDARAWKQSGFQVIPSGALSLVRRVEAIEPQPIPPGRLAPYERAGDASLLQQVLHLERRLTEEEFIVGQTDWLDAVDTLGLSQ